MRLVSLATQKFISDILNDALKRCKLRGAGQTSKKGNKVCVCVCVCACVRVCLHMCVVDVGVVASLGCCILFAFISV